MRLFSTNNGRGCRRFAVLGAVLALCLCWAGTARAVTQLKPGMDAPEIILKDVAGTEVNTAQLHGRVIIVVFGELYHDKTREACAQLETVLRDERLHDEKITPLLIAAQEAKSSEDFQTQAARSVAALTVLRDPERKAFWAYQVAVMPSVVVIDKEGHVVVAVAGLIPRFADLISDALLFATGKLSAEQYQKTLHPQTQPATAADDATMQADRLTALARQLARRGMDELAAEKFTEALQLDPHQTTAHLELGMLQLKRRRLAEAETQFRAVLAEQPTNLEATLGLALVQTDRGGAELDPAERAVRAVLARNPTLPRAYYLLGLIAQQRGKAEDAAASFKKAAELLLERSAEEPAK